MNDVAVAERAVAVSAQTRPQNFFPTDVRHKTPDGMAPHAGKHFVLARPRCPEFS